MNRCSELRLFFCVVSRSIYVSAKSVLQEKDDKSHKETRSRIASKTPDKYKGRCHSGQETGYFIRDVLFGPRVELGRSALE